MYIYKVFGLFISSEFPIEMLSESSVDTPSADVTIISSDLTEYNQLYEGRNEFIIEPEYTYFRVPDTGSFLIEGTDSIKVHRENDAKAGELAVFILGSCMGAILHHRGLFLMHGSCVEKNGKAILITGDSGAGKSTLAAEFLSNGWRLLTDDVCIVKDIENNNPTVQSSYPSQKLWQDAADKYRPGEELLPLFQEERRDKFNVRVTDYIDGTARLIMAVRLIKTADLLEVNEIEGFAKVDQLMKNTYRYLFIPEDKKQEHFQRCVTLGNQIKMLYALRPVKTHGANEIYNRITEFAEKIGD